MTTFLEYINTADVETLEEMPGVSRALAERIADRRPFAEVEDLLQVSGIGEKTLERLQKSYEQERVAQEEAAPLPAAAEETPASPEVPSRSDAPAPHGVTPVELSKARAGGQRMGKALGVVLRGVLVLALILGCLATVGAGVYYGSPFLYQRIIQPVEQNAARIDQAATQLASDRDAVNSQLTELQSRIDLLAGRLDAAEATLSDHTAAIAQLESIQALLEEDLGNQREGVLVELKFQVMTLRAMELLSRARLYLSQSNFGVARQDVAAAREIIAKMNTVALVERLPALNAVLDRLDLTLGNLPDFPVIAANDLEIAWQLLLQGLPADLPPTPTLTPEPPTATPQHTQTPIPLLTPEPEATATSQG